MFRISGATPRPRAAFTLIEILVTVAIIALLISLVLPLLGRTLSASRGFKCQQSLRSVAYDFHIFADDSLHGFRGNGDHTSEHTFELDNFVESQYSVDEFWEWPRETRHDLPDLSGNDPMRCPEVRGIVTLRANQPCTNGAIAPSQNISFGFNIRLRTGERLEPTPRPVWVALTSGISEASNVPLAWDVDGAAAVAIGSFPLFSGPSLDSPAVFAGNRYWFPGMRHNGAANFAFIDGHVESSMHPLDEPTWNWSYCPVR